MWEWLHYNSAGGSFHTKKLCSRLCSIEIEFYSKKNKGLLSKPLFAGLRGNVHTPSIAHWKPVVDFLFVIIELFSLSLMAETL